MYTIRCTMYTIRCTMYDIRCTMYDIQCTTYNVRRVTHNVYIVHTTLIKQRRVDFPRSERSAPTSLSTYTHYRE